MRKKIIIQYVTFFLILSSAVFAEDIHVVVYALHDYPPYSYEENNKIKGIYTEILKKAFSRMEGYNVEIKPVPWKRGLSYLEEGTGFALYPPYYHPEKRPFIKPYSEPILEEKVVVFCSEKILEKPRPVWPDDYYGLKIGKNSGYEFGGKKFWKAVKEGKITLDETNGNRQNILKMGAGRIDCYMNDQLAITWEKNRLMKTGEYRKSFAEVRIGASISSEFGYLGFTDRDNGKFYYKEDFVKKFNAILKEMKQNGEVQEIIEDFVHG